MAILYKPSKYAFYTEGDSLTEQEHIDSCDINLMLKNASRGLDVRGGGSSNYGYDDTTMDGVQFRNEKARLEENLGKLAAENEFTEEELDSIPADVKKRFQFKTKSKNPKSAEQNAIKQNDDQTTKQKNAEIPAESTKTNDKSELPS